MLPEILHLHKNRLNNSLNILLFLLPVFVFALLVAMSYTFLSTTSWGDSPKILGDEAFNQETWEYQGF
ncbi:hypothetical protein A2V56_02770 [Candidatus Woesebacteria bacterium RBG_19FT_COMBO_42_9]|uniref:Uncharacterized protein n=1 Tax=Candidatus Woesebacteria bacterium RBG_16_42_24 TaxID=1802485 RepID=A0A1F7XK68_9BACT|nr:MAG: hypothetical protein A2V97_02190 [Candidatus Woesebacteria bacterium RBG_16_42_24]OGM16250.1 MAG: hypothetical protein A2V56_02770 [Candidatus Woesebacteria bacterium RBG_19FT_COMBO_42_9]OGM67807.1 MAG: hypothetical protein A2985_04860 [Candidatus Woesebacteria bacterium RIFCSPLOWO2_01_FULL_43_11]